MAKNTALEALIAATGKKGTEFAEASNIKIGTLRNYLAGKRRNPRMLEVQFMAEAAGVSYETMRAAIVGGSESSPLPTLRSDDALGFQNMFEVRALSTLSTLLDDAGCSADDLAFLSGVDLGLVKSLWDDLQWMERASGAVIQAFVGAVPGIDTYLREQAIHGRIAGIADKLRAGGLELRWDVVSALSASGKLDQYVVHALQAASLIVQQDAIGARAYLSRFWGRRQDLALGHVFRGDGDGLLRDSSPLVQAASALRAELTPDDTAASGIAAANLVHYLAADVDPPTARPATRATAFVYRSRMMGKIIGSNDIDVAERYCSEVAASGVLQAIEDWSFPTYSGDCKATEDFSLPRSVLLQHTGREIVRELEAYNDAYLHYLVTVGIPIALKRDTTFGGLRADLRAAVQVRQGRGVDAATRKRLSALLVSL